MYVLLPPLLMALIIRHMAQEQFRLTPPPPLREDDVERACLDLLMLRGYKPLRQQSGVFLTPDTRRWVRVGEPGIPDYVCMHERYPAFLLETKRPKGKASDIQRQKIWELQVGYRLAVAVADSVTALASWLDVHESKTKG